MNNKKIRFPRLAIFLAAFFVVSPAAALLDDSVEAGDQVMTHAAIEKKSGLKPMSEDQLSRITGQALFVSDKISPTGATGSPTDFTFYRMGLDVELALNANIDKIQLGCGGFNDTIVPGACDIDMDFVRLMGLNAQRNGPGDPVTSDFVLTRPFIEIAVRNDGDGSLREVAGIKIGSQTADGYFGVGRDYLNPDGSPSGLTNQEHGGQCSDNIGAGALACHSGINRLSGAIGTELSGTVPINVTLSGDSNTCFGRTSNNSLCADNDRLFVDVTGTRLNELRIPNLELRLEGGLAGLLAGQAYAQVIENLRFVHGFVLDESPEFGLSFQREQVAFPTFDKTGYNPISNAGWWLNVPELKVLDLVAEEQSFGLFEALNALSPPGIPLENIELGQRAPDNCFGSSMFC